MAPRSAFIIQIGENNSESAGVMRRGTQGRSPFVFLFLTVLPVCLLHNRTLLAVRIKKKTLKKRDVHG